MAGTRLRHARAGRSRRATPARRGEGIGQAHLRGDGRREDGELAAAADAEEEVHVEEVHDAERDEERAELPCEHLGGFDGGVRAVGLHDEGGVSEVEEIEADDEEAVHGLGHLRGVLEDVLEEDGAAPEEHAREPDGQPDGDDGVRDVDGDEERARGDCRDGDGGIRLGKAPLGEAKIEHVQFGRDRKLGPSRAQVNGGGRKVERVQKRPGSPRREGAVVHDVARREGRGVASASRSLPTRTARWPRGR